MGFKQQERLDYIFGFLGKFASGDIRKNIHIWRMMEGGTWAVDQKPLNAHRSSVEDLQWSPSEDDVSHFYSNFDKITLIYFLDVGFLLFRQNDTAMGYAMFDNGSVRLHGGQSARQ